MADNNPGPSRKKKKTRGPGKLDFLNNIPEGGKFELEIYDGKPIGETGTYLSHYIGALAKDGHLLPLTVANWKYMREANINRVMTQLKASFNIPETVDGHVLFLLNTAWRKHKSAMKTKGFSLLKSEEENFARRPKGVVENQWAPLVEMWYKEENQKIAEQNTENIKKQTLKHTGGSKPHLQYAKELQDKTGEKPDRFDVFEVTHRKNRVNPNEPPVMEPPAAELYERMVEVRHKASQPDSGILLVGRNDVVAEVMGRDVKGRTRCLGSVKPREYWGDQAGSSGKNSILQSEIDSLRQQLAEEKRKNSVQQEDILALRAHNLDLQAQLHAYTSVGYRPYPSTDDQVLPPNNQGPYHDDFLNDEIMREPDADNSN